MLFLYKNRQLVRIKVIQIYQSDSLMKKLTLLFLFLCLGYTASAQIEIGIQVSPSVTSNRFIAVDRHGFKQESAGLGIGIGIVADYFFAQNYAFSTGLLYRSKGSKISYLIKNDDDLTGMPERVQDDLSIQYLEVPATIKLFTNEIAPATILYFQAGTSLNTKVAASVNDKKVLDDGKKSSSHFNIFEVDALIGAGAEMQMGESTKIFGGVSYHRGLTNIDDYYQDALDDDNIAIKNQSFAINFGVKF